MCFEKTLVHTSLRQYSRLMLIGIDFVTIIVEHNEGRPRRRIRCCIDRNPMVFSRTNEARNNLIAAPITVSTARTRSRELDVPDLPEFQ